MTAEFVNLLRRGLEQEGTQKALAGKLGLSEQRISAALKGSGYAFGVLNCLRLALLIDESPTVVLRAAGKREIADLLDEIYGRPQVTGSEARDLAALLALPADARAQVRALMRMLAPKTRRRSR